MLEFPDEYYYFLVCSLKEHQSVCYFGGGATHIVPSKRIVRGFPRTILFVYYYLRVSVKITRKNRIGKR